ncbi:EF-hand calcium-binding domain protein [Madurella fahalii]|uniref:EF-hand calcium-binding domain protein n=1 Tax=Madurella fahalii TaxID=1157608 RepID=A0ABQ0G3M9_9PEZI
MRFLCLHGRGTNSNILEAQLAPLRSRLHAQHTFDFIDGEGNCGAAPGMSGSYPPPYLCWYERGSPRDVHAAQEYLRSIIDEDGPYDGLIGFSEGAALAASLLLSDESPAAEPRFKVAILFNSVVPLVPSGSDRLGASLSETVHGHQDSYLDLLLPEEQRDSATEQERSAVLSQALCFSPKGSPKISIPTVHVIGERDPFAESSRVVVDLCIRDTAQVIIHDGGHELPRDNSVLDRCAELIETAVLFAS